jgi:hypothetical protein
VIMELADEITAVELTPVGGGAIEPTGCSPR